MRPRQILPVLFFLLLGTCLCFASPTRIITLKDGSVLKGEILGFSDGQYTVNTPNLGQIKLKDADILRIDSPGNAAAASTNAQPSSSLKSQVQQIQGKVLQDKNLVNEFQNLLQDPKIIQLLSDPSFVKDIMSYDEETIRNNPGVQQLLQNSQIQQLMKEIGQKYSQPQQ